MQTFHHNFLLHKNHLNSMPFDSDKGPLILDIFLYLMCIFSASVYECLHVQSIKSTQTSLKESRVSLPDVILLKHRNCLFCSWRFKSGISTEFNIPTCSEGSVNNEQFELEWWRTTLSLPNILCNITHLSTQRLCFLCQVNAYSISKSCRQPRLIRKNKSCLV